MRVLHLNSSFAGVPILADALCCLGVHTDVASFDVRTMQIESDYLLRASRLSISRVWEFGKLARHYDILHFHYHSALPSTYRYIDFPLWMALGKKVVMHYRGDDIRGHRRWFPRRYADAILVSTPDLLEWEPEAVWVPPVRLAQYVGVSNNGRMKVAHAPSDRTVKGTEDVIKAVESLRGDGIPLDLDLIENVSFNEVLERYRQADVVVDQLKIGWYGGAAIEAMSMGKPVLCYIRPDLEGRIPVNALWSATKDTLTQRIKALWEWPELRLKLSQQGFAYAKQVHDPITVAKQLKAIYESL